MKKESAYNLLLTFIKQKSKDDAPKLMDYLYGYSQLLGTNADVITSLLDDKYSDECANTVKIFEKNNIDIKLIKQSSFILCTNESVNIDISQLLNELKNTSETKELHIDVLLTRIIEQYPYVKDLFHKGKDLSEILSSKMEGVTDNLKENDKESIESGHKPNSTTNNTSPYERLNNLIGLEEIKRDVNGLVNLMKMQIRRKEQGLKAIPVSLHLVFSGNPGTGKTTIARILAEIYKDIGILSKGQLVEVDRSGLVAGYVGQTALKTQEKIDEALGGILFIDEAYTLVKDGNDYGQEAIDTILKAMEDHRDDFIVIVAGYTGLMQKFINSNPGLKSRFSKYINFPDYSADELIQIFMMMSKEYQFKLTDAAKEKMKDKICDLEAHKGRNFANARDVRNMFEAVVTNQASRLAEDPSGDIMEITAEDFN